MKDFFVRLARIVCEILITLGREVSRILRKK